MTVRVLTRHELWVTTWLGQPESRSEFNWPCLGELDLGLRNNTHLPGMANTCFSYSMLNGMHFPKGIFHSNPRYEKLLHRLPGQPWWLHSLLNFQQYQKVCFCDSTSILMKINSSSIGLYFNNVLHSYKCWTLFKYTKAVCPTFFKTRALNVFYNAKCATKKL